MFIARSTASTSSGRPKLDRAEARLDDAVRDGGLVVEPHELDDRQLAHARVRPRGNVGVVILLRQRQPLEVGAPLHHGVVAVLNGFAHPREVDGAQLLGKRRHEQHVVRRELRALLDRAGAREHVRELRRDIEHRAQRLARQQPGRDVHGNDGVRAHVARHVHGQVHRDAAVDEQPPVDLDGRKRRWDRHAGPDRAGEAAFAEHDGLARHDVAGDGAERDRELIEALHLRGPQRLARDDHVDDLTLHEADRQLELAVVQARLLVDEEEIVVALAAKRLQLPRHRVQERGFPLEALDELLELRDAHSRDVETTDDCADAGTGHVVDGHAQLLERLQDPDVSAAARAAAR